MVPSHHGLSYQSQGCSRGGGGWGVFPSSFPTWTGPSPPTAWQLGPQPPPQHGFPLPPGKRPPSRQNCLPDPSFGGGPAWL